MTTTVASQAPRPAVLAGGRGEPSEIEMVLGTQRVLGLLGGRWTIELLYLLARGRRRYVEIWFELGSMSKKTLTAALRRLEREGLISREVISQYPHHVEYSLTPLGWSITDPIMALYEWSAEHRRSERPHLAPALDSTATS